MSEQEKPQALDNKAMNALLPTATSAKYRVTMQHRTSPCFLTKDGEFDLRTLSVAQAKMLVKRKANWIEPIGKNDPNEDGGGSAETKKAGSTK